MKGFIISPILFVSLMLIVGVIIINFSEIDKSIAEGIGIEGRAKKILAEQFENEISTRNLILFYGVEAAKTKASETEVEDEIKSGLGVSAADIKISSCDANAFIVDYSDYNFQSTIFDVKIDKTAKISRELTCDHYKKIIGGAASLRCDGGTQFCP